MSKGFLGLSVVFKTIPGGRAGQACDVQSPEKEGSSWRLEGLQDPGSLSCLIPSQGGLPLTPPSLHGDC